MAMAIIKLLPMLLVTPFACSGAEGCFLANC
jgi:hypothetical protein